MSSNQRQTLRVDRVLGGKMCVLTAGVGGLYFVAHVLFCFFKSVFCWFEQELLVESQKSELQKVKDWRNK